MTTSPPDPDADLLRAFLANRDAPCPHCGYNLRTLQSHQCPECGEALTLRVGLVQPKMAAYLTGLIGLAAGAGFSGLLVIYALVQQVLHRGFPPSRFMVSIGVGLAVEGVLLAFWLSRRPRILKASPSTRWLLALACWAATLTNIIAFSLRVR